MYLPAAWLTTEKTALHYRSTASSPLSTVFIYYNHSLIDTAVVLALDNVMEN